MINFQCFGSSSGGNLYIVSDGQTYFILECGFPVYKIRKKIGKLSDYDACFVSHSHGDHARAIKQILAAALPVYATQGTFDSLGIDHHRAQVLEYNTWVQIGTFQVYTFQTLHDVDEPAGFIFVSGNESLLFATDTYAIEPQFKGLTHLAIECNYIDYLLEQNIENGALPLTMYNRIKRSHMSLDNCLKYITDIDKSKLREIHLLHLSDGNSNAEKMKDAVQKVSGCFVNVCEKE